MSPALFLFLKITLAIQLWVFLCLFVCFGFGVVPFKLKEYFHSFEKCHWEFDKDRTESLDCFGLYGHFKNIDFSNPRAQNMFPFVCVFFHFFH